MGGACTELMSSSSRKTVDDSVAMVTRHQLEADYHHLFIIIIIIFLDSVCFNTYLYQLSYFSSGTILHSLSQQGIWVSSGQIITLQSTPKMPISSLYWNIFQFNIFPWHNIWTLCLISLTLCLISLSKYMFIVVIRVCT